MSARLGTELWFASVGRWPVALAVVLAVPALLWAVVPATERQARQQQLLAQGERAAPLPVAAAPAGAETLAAFEKNLATDADVDRLMRQIWQHGGAAGLHMNKVDYRVETDAGGGFKRLLVTLPLSGTYPAVKSFAFTLMAAFPTLSLDKLDIKREHAAQGEVETTLHMSLLTRP